MTLLHCLHCAAFDDLEHAEPDSGEDRCANDSVSSRVDALHREGCWERETVSLNFLRCPQILSTSTFAVVPQQVTETVDGVEAESACERYFDEELEPHGCHGGKLYEVSRIKNLSDTSVRKSQVGDRPNVKHCQRIEMSGRTRSDKKAIIQEGRKKRSTHGR